MQQEVALLHEFGAGSLPLSSDELDEAPLVEAARRGQASAFEQLFHTHGGRMKSVAMNLLGNTADAEDAVQEAFLKLYRSLPGFKGESLLSTWLYRILVNTCYDMGRRRRRRAEPPAPEPEQAPAPDPPAPEADLPLRLTLERAVAGLREPQRTVFLLYEVEGFKHREVAQILGIPEGTSKHALFMAKRNLQASILAARPEASA